jgi:hypothetical protein
MRKAKAAAYVDCAVPTFDKMVAAGAMPAPFDLGNAPAWDLRDLDAAVDAIKAGATGRGNWKERAPARA